MADPASIRVFSYSQGVPVELLTSQLSFDSDNETIEFLTTHNAAHLKPAPPATPLGKQSVDTKKAIGPLAESLRKMQAADLKGQI